MTMTLPDVHAPWLPHTTQLAPAPAEPNPALAWRVLDYIEAHPERHNQSSWIDATRAGMTDRVVDRNDVEGSCGTTACFAGWTLLLSGATIDLEDHMAYNQVSAAWQGVARFAADLLGISEAAAPCGCSDCNDRPATRLFYRAETIEDLRKAVFDVFGPRPDGVI